MEAVTVAVTLHLVQKLAIGREGPTDGDGLGIIYGPTEGIHLYPAGTLPNTSRLACGPCRRC